MPKTAFLFPGQGSQSVGMGLELYNALPAAKRLFDDAYDILGYSLIDICGRGPVDKLNSTVVSQPAIYVTSLAALENLRVKEPAAFEECVAAAGPPCSPSAALARVLACTLEGSTAGSGRSQKS